MLLAAIQSLNYNKIIYILLVESVPLNIYAKTCAHNLDLHELF